MSKAKTLRRFFLCTGETVLADQLENYPGSHIIGELRHVLDGDQMVSALAVYEFSMSYYKIPPMDLPIRIEVIGDARKIKCTRCYRSKQRWEISRKAYLQLQERFN